jgi:hypothetical protein
LEPRKELFGKSSLTSKTLIGPKRRLERELPCLDRADRAIIRQKIKALRFRENGFAEAGRFLLGWEKGSRNTKRPPPQQIR